MSRIGRTCSVPTEACAYQVPRVAVLFEYLRQAVGVLGKVLERHRAVLDEGHGFAVALHGHHDVEAALRTSHRSFCCETSVISTDAAGKPEIGHELHQLLQFALLDTGVLARETRPAESHRARP